MTWWIRVQTSVTDTEPSEKWPTPSNQHIEIPQIQYTDKVADESVAVQRHISPRTTESKAPEHQQDDRSGGDADKDVQGEAITKYSWSGGKKMIVFASSDLFNLTVTVCTQQIFKLTGLANEITGVKVAQKKGTQTVSLKLAKKEKKTWHKLLGEASTNEAVVDDTANSYTSITSRVSQTTLSDFSKNLEEPSPTEKEKAIDEQTRSMDSHGIRCERSTGVIFVQTLVHCSFLARS